MKYFVSLVVIWNLLDLLLTALLITDCGRSTEGLNWKDYDMRRSMFEFFPVALLRTVLLFGASLALFINRKPAVERIQASGLVATTVFITFASYSPFKLLALSEFETELETAYFKWGLLLWNWVASNAGFVWWYKLGNIPPAPEGSGVVGGEDDLAILINNDHTSRNSTNISSSSSSSSTSFSESKEKSPDEKKISLRGSVGLMGRLLRYYRREWQLYLCGFSALFIYSAARIFIPSYTSQVIANVVLYKDYNRLIHSVLVMAGLSLASAVFGGIRGGCFSYAIAKVNRIIRGDLFASLAHQEIGFFDTTKTGELTSRLTADCQTMSDTVGLNVNVFLRNMVMFIGSLIFMFKLSWRMSLITFIAMPLIGLISKVYGAYNDRLSKETQDSLAVANEVADEVMSSMRTVRSFAAENLESERYRLRLDEVLKIKLKQTFAYVGYIWTTEFFDLILLTAVLWYGGHLVIDKKLKSEDMIAFLLYQLQLGETLIGMGAVYTGLMQSVGASRKVFEYIDRVPKILYEGTFRPSTDDFKGDIRFDNVSFAYPSRPDKTVVKATSKLSISRTSLVERGGEDHTDRIGSLLSSIGLPRTGLGHVEKLACPNLESQDQTEVPQNT